MKKITHIFLSLLMVLSLSSCEDFLKVAPSDEYSDTSVFTDINGAQQVLTGAYNWFTSGWYAHYTNQYIFFMPDVMGDDAMVNSTGNYDRFVNAYQYSVIPSSTYSVDPWIGCYSLIDNCNAILDNLESLPESNQRDRIEGEALSLRVYAYHWLVRIYAKPVKLNPESPGVILRLSSGTQDLPRATVKDCYTLLTGDIERACTLLTNNSSSSKCYITENAAHAIAARVYLDLGDYTKGVEHAHRALSGLTLMSASEYKDDMCENNSETIWYFTCTSTDKQNYLSLPAFWYYCDDDGTYLADGYSSLGVAKEFVDIFDDSDVRKSQFVRKDGHLYQRNGSIMINKIRHRNNGNATGPNTGTVAFAEGDFNMLRGSEMYLIIAELAADNDKPEALTALNTVRRARGILDYSGSGDALKTEIQNERRRELFAEGHRLFDIKRRNQALDRSSLSLDWSRVGVLQAGSDKFELPIPQDEIDGNNALTGADQNPAYK